VLSNAGASYLDVFHCMCVIAVMCRRVLVQAHHNNGEQMKTAISRVNGKFDSDGV
jgi:hypothetical protein